MRSARILTSALLTSTAVLGPAGALAYADSPPGGSPAYADSAPGGALELWPTSASPGTTVTANTTACGSSGRATGDANAVGSGDFPLTTSTHKEVLAGQFQVASPTKPGSFPIRVSCENGKVVEARLTVTGKSDHEHDQWTKDKPWDPGAQQDRDKGWGHDDQHGRDKGWGHDDPAARDKAWEGNDPHGHVKTGVGGSIGPDTTEIAAGAAVLAAAAVGGTWLLRRRASGAQGRG
ncbi:hypothetical protein ACFYNY_02835 [Streptomyces sp. NPDC006530]|uniref:hypothetical protein n=1 Tax=Streptomyces sp. NPDC006530 TaxID=3364750 RepID=UPI0036C8ED22